MVEKFNIGIEKTGGYYDNSSPKEVAQSGKAQQPLLSFKTEEENDSVSDKKVLAWATNQTEKTPKEKTEDFKKDILNKLTNSKSAEEKKQIEYYLSKLVTSLQEYNGVKKNNLKPNGNEKQNNAFDLRMQQLNQIIKACASLIDSGLGLTEDPETGVLNLTINDEVYEVPERKVNIIMVGIISKSPNLEFEFKPNIVE